MDVISARDESLSRLPCIPDIPHNDSGTRTFYPALRKLYKLETGLENRGISFQGDVLRSERHINPIDTRWSRPLFKCIGGSLQKIIMA